MSMLRFDPFREFAEFDRTWRRAAVVPMDAYRRGDEVVIRLDLPGIDPGALDITVERDTLTVSATRQWERGDDENVLASERPQGTFTRRILLGESLDTSRLEASYDLGVLTVTVPVAEQAQPRKITVATGEPRTSIEAESKVA
jgi:HSP20 family protein